MEVDTLPVPPPINPQSALQSLLHYDHPPGLDGHSTAMTVSQSEPPLQSQRLPLPPAQMPNPWHVASHINDLLFYCCLECDYKSKTVAPLQDHALENHPKAQSLFANVQGRDDQGLLVQDFDVDVKVEEMDEDEDIDYDPSFEVVRPKAKSSRKAKKRKAKTKVKYEEDESNGFDFNTFDNGSDILQAKTEIDGGIKTESGISDDPGDKKVDINESFREGMREHKCQHCDKVLKGLWDYTLHLRYAHTGVLDENECPGCAYRGPNKRSVKTHILRVHEKNYVPCPGCDKVFLDVALKAHIKLVHNRSSSDEDFKCTVEGCNFETKARNTLWQHMKFKHEKHKFICDLCGKTFPYNALLKKHKDEFHLGLKNHVCDKCGKSFSEAHLLRQHVAQPTCDYLTKRDKTFNCDECDSEFDMLKAYIFHHKRVHGSFPSNVGEVGPTFMCDECPAVFLSDRGMKRHKEIKHEGKARPKDKSKNLKCPHCDRVFSKNLNYTEHVRSKHENNTPFRCDLCPKAYGTEPFLKIHIHNTHKRPKCEICGKEICNKLWLKRHMAKVHGVMPEKSFPCDVCSFVFDTEDSKSKHMMKQHAPPH